MLCKFNCKEAKKLGMPIGSDHLQDFNYKENKLALLITIIIS